MLLFRTCISLCTRTVLFLCYTHSLVSSCVLPHSRLVHDSACLSTRSADLTQSFTDLAECNSATENYTFRSPNSHNQNYHSLNLAPVKTSNFTDIIGVLSWCSMQETKYLSLMFIIERSVCLSAC
jgi:hypothetical protein